jgi:hypothetical protein
MKQMKLFIFLLVFFLANIANAQIFKRVDVGKLQGRVYDHGCQSEDVKVCGMAYYYRGSKVDVREFSNMWPGGILKNAGMFFGSRNWTDTTGYTWAYNVTGHACRKRGSEEYQFAIPDEDGTFIRRYMRYPLPQIIVDGVHTEAPFPMFGDEVAPEKIWGTADVMVESHFRLSMGLDVIQRVLAWSQVGHDDYIIYDFTFINTGNVNKDSEIELPGQTLEDVYITKIYEAMPNEGDFVFPTWAGTTVDHDTRLSYPQDDDSLRISYVTPTRKYQMGYDSYGHKGWGGEMNILDAARFSGHAVLFAPKTTDFPQGYPNHPESNDPVQPMMHSGMEDWIVWDFPGLDSAGYYMAYRKMMMGTYGMDSTSLNFKDSYPMDSLYNVYDYTYSGGETYYEQPMDRWGEADPVNRPKYLYPKLIPYYGWMDQPKFSIGPYDMEYGDTLRYVYAVVAGAINRKNSYLGGQAWDDKEAASYSWLADLDSAEMVEELRRRDPIFDIYGESYPQLLIPDGLNDIAKDLLVVTGRDSLFNNGMAAQRNFNKNYNIPESPAPPSVFEVNSRPDMIELKWSYDPAYEPTDLVGFKIYRATGGAVFLKEGDLITGDWKCVDSVGPGARVYEDKEDVTPAVDYYYAITAVSTAGIESGKFLTMTQEPFAARLTSLPGASLDQIRIVPNPLNINAAHDYRYPADPYKLAFINLPGICTIQIFTESGELVRKIEHTDGSGIAVWHDGQRFLTTDSDQIPASGIYIANIQTPDGRSINCKFLIVR